MSIFHLTFLHIRETVRKNKTCKIVPILMPELYWKDDQPFSRFLLPTCYDLFAEPCYLGLEIRKLKSVETKTHNNCPQNGNKKFQFKYPK